MIAHLFFSFPAMGFEGVFDEKEVSLLGVVSAVVKDQLGEVHTNVAIKQMIKPSQEKLTLNF